MPARAGDGRRVGVDGLVVDAPVESVGHLLGVTHQQRVPAGGHIGAVGGQSVVGHGDRVAGVQPVMGGIPVHGAADGRRAAVPQR